MMLPALLTVGVILIASVVAFLIWLWQRSTGEEVQLADHVYEQRKKDLEDRLNGIERVDKKGWSPVHTPTDDTTRLEDNYAQYRAIELGYKM